MKKKKKIQEEKNQKKKKTSPMQLQLLLLSPGGKFMSCFVYISCTPRHPLSRQFCGKHMSRLSLVRGARVPLLQVPN